MDGAASISDPLTRPVLRYVRSLEESTMNATDRLCHTQWLEQILATLRRFRTARTSAELGCLRDDLVPLVWDSRAPRAQTFAAEGDRFRRHPLASVEALGCSALLMYWPPGHATLPHDHDGLWGIEIVVDGELNVEEFVKSGANDRPTLSLARSLRLDAGDAAMFADGRYVHRCRNLSNVAPTLTLHVYGGVLSSYTSFDGDLRGELVPARHTTVNDRTLS
jgi:Cysteine dioxygenase type I